jgi:hypothetical protein
VSVDDSDDVLSPEAAAEMLPQTDVGQYLRAAFPAIAPPRLTRRTVWTLIQYLDHRSSVWSKQIVHDLTDSRPGLALRDRWIAEGGSEDVLVKFVTMGEYRIRTLREASALRSLEPGAPTELEAFWVAGGHDMTELARYLSEVDREVGDWLPK